MHASRPCMMPMATSSGIHLPIPFPTGNRRGAGIPANAQALRSCPAEEERRHRPRSTSVKRPTVLSSMLHLDVAKRDAALVPGSDRCAVLPTFSPKEDISALRDELNGSGEWDGLLDPLHPWLRREIVKYGEFSQATYDAFDFNPVSQYCGSCLYGRGRLFDKLGLAPHGYAAAGYVYAMAHLDLPRWLERSLHADAWSRDSNWMGYVAVSGDAESRRLGCRDIVVAWRGTVGPAEWLEDVQGSLEPIQVGGGGDHRAVKVEHGFQSMYTSKSDATRYNKRSASEQAMEQIKKLVQLYQARGEMVSLTITGHSLGGALAVLNAYEAASAMPSVPVRVISFGAPRVGNEAFGKRLHDMRVKVLRVVVKQDLVPKMPGIFFNERIKKIEKVTGALMEWVYTHVGVELSLDVRASPNLRTGIDVAGFHNLETYLHLVDGYRTAGAGFRPDAKRDVALVNKASGMLRQELPIPAYWYRPANGGLVRNAYGRWVMPQREPQDIPSPLAQELDAEAS